MSTVPGKYVSPYLFIYVLLYLRTIVCFICMNFLGMRFTYIMLEFSFGQTFNELQKLISKTYGKVVGDLMTPSPLVVRDSTNLEDAARYLLLYVFALQTLS